MCVKQKTASIGKPVLFAENVQILAVLTTSQRQKIRNKHNSYTDNSVVSG